MHGTGKKRIRTALLMACALVLVAGASIGGTLAWLATETQTVTNTFTTSGIKIELKETSKDGTSTDTGYTFQLIPGKIYEKDPVVTVDASTDVDIYLFVKKVDSTSGYITYTDNLTAEKTDWYKLEDVENVYYREVATEETTKSWHLIGTEDAYSVKVNESLGTAYGTTGESKVEANNVTLTYTAYAIQKEGFESAQTAWTQISTLAGSKL